MHPFITFIRQKLIVVVLFFGRLLYRLTGGRRPKMMFSMCSPIKRLDSSVKIVKSDNESVTIAKFRPDGTIDDSDFRILSTTDLHLGNESSVLNNKTIRLFIRQIQETKPDLVVLTGDVVLSDFQQIDAIQFSQMMEKLGVYWTYVFGNHEAREEKEYFKYLIFSSLQYYPHCLSRFGDNSLFGYGNFVVNIKNGESSLSQSLFFFDSGRDIQGKDKLKYSIPDDINGYDFIKQNQIDWYLRKLAEIKAEYGTVKSMCYMHIPIPEYTNVMELGEDKLYHPSGKCKILYGSQYEAVGCSPYNSGFFDVMLREGSTQAVFAGHDHINDFCAELNGIYLVYSQCGGYNTYTMGSNFGWDEKDWQHGITMTVIKKDGSIGISQRKNSMYL